MHRVSGNSVHSQDFTRRPTAQTPLTRHQVDGIAGHAGRARLGCLFAIALLAGMVFLAGRALLEAGWGPALRSVADRVLPNPEVTMWAPAPVPGSHASSYADATGAGTNYVYLVDATDAEGSVRELQLIFFGRESHGEGWLVIEARGGSGVRYRSCDEADVPAATREALGRAGGKGTLSCDPA